MSELAQGDKFSPATMNAKTVYVGSGAPSTTYDGQIWVDVSTDPPVAKIYDDTNSQWMTYHPVYYETQSGAWANPATTPVSNGTLVVLYNSTQAGTRLYGYSNGAWVNIMDLSLDASPTFERYYDAAILASATYTPNVSGLFHIADDGLDCDVELFYSGATWHDASTSTIERTHIPVLGDGTNLRVINMDAGNTNNLIIMRAVLQHQQPSYTRSTGTLATGASVVISTPGLYNWGRSDSEMHVEYYSDNSAQWIEVIGNLSNVITSTLFISDGTNARIINTDVGTQNYVLMRWS